MRNVGSAFWVRILTGRINVTMDHFHAGGDRGFPAISAQKPRAGGGSLVTKLAAPLLLCACVSVFTAAQNSQSIDRLSVTSLAVAVFHGDSSIGSATGFVLQKNQNYYLLTRRHVVLTCAEDTNPNNVGGWICADKVKILHNTAGHL